MIVTLRTLCGCERKIETKAPPSCPTIAIPIYTGKWYINSWGENAPYFDRREFVRTEEELPDGTIVFMEKIAEETS
jgi:hypothetical protein